ncbi:MAG TPA: aminotransferase class V-fold PLP-dependent enzyme, partial [Rubrobacter sp.]|nr:aminotransferase class V-fold PLP-dependent enzyme [Rubrobacter sp.]
GKVGLGVAVDYALRWGIEKIRDRVQYLAERLRTSLNGMPGVTVRDLGAERCGIVTFTVEGRSPESIVRALSGQGINTSVSPSASTLLDMQSRNLEGLVRASVHYYNSDEEVETFCDSLESVLSKT